MRRVLKLALTVLSLLGLLMPAGLLAGCGGAGPSETTRNFIVLLNERNFGEAYDMLAADSPARAVPAAGSDTDAREEFVRLAEANFPEGLKFDDIRILGEEVDGDRATVKWTAITKIPDTPEETTEQNLTLVKENGEWKVWQ